MKPNLMNSLKAALIISASGIAFHSSFSQDQKSSQDEGTKPVSITEVFKRDHPEQKDRDVIVQRIELLPGASAHPHIHPGMVTGYVISGKLDFQVAGEPLLHLKAGDVFFEAPGSKHLVAHNPDDKEKTVLVAFYINPKNQPTALPMTSH